MTIMTNYSRRRRFARLLQRQPGVIKALYPFYQMTRARFSMGVAGVLFDTQSRLLLAEHVYHPLIPWGIPGGSVNTGEDPAVALAREFYEELAMRVQVLEPLLVEQTHFRHVDVAFLCQSGDVPSVSSAELLDAQWFARDTLPQLTNFQYRAVMRAYALFDREPRLGHDISQS
jgi:ADP-ribose pyrophosphatase YjhB (NUDIX family)